MPVPQTLRNTIVGDHIPTSCSLHLLSELPNDTLSATGTEFPTADGYVNQPVTLNNIVGNGKTSNTTEVVFGPATDDWPDGVGWVLKDATFGTIVGWYETPIIVPAGAKVVFKISSIVVQVLQ